MISTKNNFGCGSINTITGRSPLCLIAAAKLIVAYDLSSPSTSRRLALPASTEGPSHVSRTTLGIDLGGGGQERQRTISRAGFNRTGNRQHHHQRGSWCLGKSKGPEHESRSYESRHINNNLPAQNVKQHSKSSLQACNAWALRHATSSAHIERSKIVAQGRRRLSHQAGSPACPSPGAWFLCRTLLLLPVALVPLLAAAWPSGRSSTLWKRRHLDGAPSPR